MFVVYFFVDLQIIEHSTRHPNTQNKTIFLQKENCFAKTGVLQQSRQGETASCCWLQLSPSKHIRKACIRIHSIRPRISLRAGIGRGISSGLSISSPLSIVSIVSIWAVSIVSISVWPVCVSVVSVPRISLGLRVGSGFGSGLSISRSLSIVVSVPI